MGKEIKTRTVHRNVKTMDRAATAAQHMKHSNVQIKEKMEQTQEQKEHSPVEYAQGRIMDNAERISRGATAQVKNQSGKAVKHIKEKQRLKREEKQIRIELKEGRISGQGERPSFSPSAGEKVYQPKEQMIKTAQSQAARKRAAENIFRKRRHRQSEKWNGEKKTLKPPVGQEKQ